MLLLSSFVFDIEEVLLIGIIFGSVFQGLVSH